MRMKAHMVQGAVASAVMFQYLTYAENAVLFLSVVLIDVDHWFDFAVVNRRYGVRDMFKYHGWVWKHKDAVYGISVFHTAEVFLALFLLGYLNHYFWIIFAGFIYHMALDLFSLYRHGIFFNRAFSIIEYVIRKRMPSTLGYPVPDKGFWDDEAEVHQQNTRRVS